MVACDQLPEQRLITVYPVQPEGQIDILFIAALYGITQRQTGGRRLAANRDVLGPGPEIADVRAQPHPFRPDRRRMRERIILETLDIGRQRDGQSRLVALPEQAVGRGVRLHRSVEHTSELQSLMRITYAVFSLKQKT